VIKVFCHSTGADDARLTLQLIKYASAQSNGMKSDNSEDPVVAGTDGIKLRTEKMIPDQLYHCIYENKVFLFFKDEEGMLNCYEVGDPLAVNEIAQNPSHLEEILQKYADHKVQKQA